MTAVQDYIARHRVNSERFAEATMLDGHIFPFPKAVYRIWRLGDAVIFRRKEIQEDKDGSPKAYHIPTDAFFDGHGPGFGTDSLLNAISRPPAKGRFPATEAAEKGNTYPLTSGCQLLRDYYRAKALPAASKDELKKILDDNGVTKLEELETKSTSAVCIKHIPGRPKADSHNDWSHVEAWAGVQTDPATGLPKAHTSGPLKGFYFKNVTPGWVDADVDPWVVLNAPVKAAGVNLGNEAVVVVNGTFPKAGYGMVADVGPKDGGGECSTRMLQDLGVTKAPTGDYIYIFFPGDARIAKREPDVIRREAKEKFESWQVDGRKGMAAIAELFPHRGYYDYQLEEFRKYFKGMMDCAFGSIR
jgi:hypothetical protein